MISHLVRRATLGLAALAMIGWGAGVAAAQPPVDVTGPIADPGGVLGSRTGDVRAALDDYFTQTGGQLFVVFVPSFDGLDGPDWADASAARSNLSSADILFAVATEERAYGYSVDDAQPLSDGGGFPWLPVGIGGAALAGGGILIARRRRGDGDTSDDIDKRCAAALVRVDNTLTTASLRAPRSTAGTRPRSSIYAHRSTC
jgi:hypothetical protein